MIKAILQGSAANFLNILVNLCVAVAQSSLAVRFLQPKEAGVFFLLLSVSVLFAYCDFGLGPALSREIGFSAKKKKPNQRIANLYFTVNRIVLQISVVLTVSMLLLAIGASYYFHFSKAILITCMLFIISAGIKLKSNPYLALLYGLRYVATERIIRTIAPIIGVITSLLLLYFNYGLISFGIGTCAQSITTYVLARIYISRNLSIYTDAIGKFIKLIVRRFTEPCLQWSLTALGGFLIFQSANFFIAKIIGPSAVPQYGLFLQIITCIIIISSAIMTAVIPFASKLFATRKSKQLNEILFLTTKCSVAIAITLAVFFALYIKSVMLVWVGNKVAIQHVVFLVLLVTTILEVHHIIVSQIAMACGYVKFAVPSLLAGIITIILLIPFIKWWGVLGAAIAVFVAQLITNNWYSVYISLRFLRIEVISFVKQVALPLLVYFAVVFGLSYGCYALFGRYIKNTYLHLLTGVIFVGMIGVFAGIAILINNEQKKVIKKLLGNYLKTPDSTL